jgi:hypothetical protein
MKQTAVLVISSLLAILFGTFHLTDDIIRGFAPGGLSNVPVVLVVTIWLYATLLLAERRSGYVIILVMSLLSSGMPVIHMTGKRGITSGIPLSSGSFFFVWTLFALGVTAAFSVVLSVRGLWSLQRQRRSAIVGSTVR